MASSIQITGLKELSEMLTQIAPKAAKSYMVKVHKAAAQKMIEEFADSAPDDKGILKDSIVYQNKWEAGDGTDSLVTRVGPDKHVPWGMWQEFGTSTMAGKHWMGNAWDKAEGGILDLYMQNINELYARMISKDQSIANIENDAQDRQTGQVSAPRLRRDRNAAYRENDERNRVSGVQTSSGIKKSENEASEESKHRK
jgi:HK97 gp10 family phage protein